MGPVKGNKVFDRKINRREFCKISSALPLAALISPPPVRANDDSFQLRYIVGSCMYGKMELAEILSQVHNCHAEHIDIWPAPHANHREQIDKTGHRVFMETIRRHRVGLGIISRYDLGPFNLDDEMHIAKSFGAKMIICSSRGPKNLKADALKKAVHDFIDSMKPHLALAEKLGITIGIENHANSLISGPDSIRYFAELSRSKNTGIALAPYHLHQDPVMIANLIDGLNDRLVHFYAWQHGKGCMEKLPKEQELLQMPGRGSLNFKPILAALKRINYKGWTEIFMHPVPRGIPILPTAEAVTAEINRARRYLEQCLAETDTT